MRILQVPSPNYTSGRQGRRIIAIVNHITAGLMPGTLSWLRNPASNVSAHYLVTKSGDVYQLVKDEDTAWHAGIVNRPIWELYDGSNPNRYTLGIEHEALSGEGLTEVQYQATMELHRILIERWRIPVDRNHIIGHNLLDTVNRVNDPGPKFPWDRLMEDLRNGVIDLALEKWMLEGGQAAIDDLYKKGLLFNPENWNSEEELAQPVPAYLFWIMINRLQEKLAGQS